MVDLGLWIHIRMTRIVLFKYLSNPDYDEIFWIRILYLIFCIPDFGIRVLESESWFLDRCLLQDSGPQIKSQILIWIQIGFYYALIRTWNDIQEWTSVQVQITQTFCFFKIFSCNTLHICMVFYFINSFVVFFLEKSVIFSPFHFSCYVSSIPQHD